jgi:hypothetical protein
MARKPLEEPDSPFERKRTRIEPPVARPKKKRDRPQISFEIIDDPDLRTDVAEAARLVRLKPAEFCRRYLRSEVDRVLRENS